MLMYPSPGEAALASSSHEPNWRNVIAAGVTSGTGATSMVAVESVVPLPGTGALGATGATGCEGTLGNAPGVAVVVAGTPAAGAVVDGGVVAAPFLGPFGFPLPCPFPCA